MRAGLAAAALVATAATPATAQTRPIAPSKVILVGDSTVQGGTGWGGSFCATRVTSAVACVNLGRGGRSSKSYRVEGSWTLAEAEMRVPGYRTVWVLIQFGHNDHPNAPPERRTDLAREFPDNLRRYVREARAAGATPVLVTPLTRRMFTAGVLTADLDPWAAATRAVATELAVPLVDLNARSKAIVTALGPAGAAHLANAVPPPEVMEAALTGTTISAAKTPPTPRPARGDDAPPALPDARAAFDYTHINRDGADLFAAAVAEDLARAVPAMRPLLYP